MAHATSGNVNVSSYYVPSHALYATEGVDVSTYQDSQFATPFKSQIIASPATLISCAHFYNGSGKPATVVLAKKGRINKNLAKVPTNYNLLDELTLQAGEATSYVMAPLAYHVSICRVETDSRGQNYSPTDVGKSYQDLKGLTTLVTKKANGRFIFSSSVNRSDDQVHIINNTGENIRIVLTKIARNPGYGSAQLGPGPAHADLGGKVIDDQLIEAGGYALFSVPDTVLKVFFSDPDASLNQYGKSIILPFPNKKAETVMTGGNAMPGYITAVVFKADYIGGYESVSVSVNRAQLVSDTLVVTK